MSSRREFLQAAGALVVSFALPDPLRAQVATPKDKAALYASVDAWLAVGADGRVTVFAGKVELGTGVETAMAQIVAEELDVAVERISMVMADTARCPDQGTTAGSKTIHFGGPQLRRAAAEAREALLALASVRLQVPVERLQVMDGVVSVTGEPQHKVEFRTLVGGRKIERTVRADVRVKSPDQYRVVGKPVRRVDIPGKVLGSHPYVHNFSLPGMLHGRVVRPMHPGADLDSVDEASVNGLPGFVRIVTRGNFVGIVAEREEQAIRIAREIKLVWRAGNSKATHAGQYDAIRSAPTQDRVADNIGNVETTLAGAARVLSATYQTPFQTHGSIGPSCAVAEGKDGQLTVWSGTQGAFNLRSTLADLVGISAANIRVIWMEASGCYGHNGADDAAADAAILALAVGKPVRVQWMRHDEHGWDPKGPAMVMDVRGALDATGACVAWDFAVRTPTHSTRPAGSAGNLLAGQLAGSPPKAGLSGGDRNARHTYVFPNDRVTVRWLASSALRSSALRGLGAPQNSFANESFMDELAAAAGADPIEFRVKHLKDERAIAVLRAVANIAGWRPRASFQTPSRGNIARGRGVAYAQYETETAYAAMVVHVEVDRSSGVIRVPRVFVAHDCGLVINPDGVRNQIEGNVIQTISRTLYEEVSFGPDGVSSLDWASYPILRFSEVPDAIESLLINRPDQPAVGAGEPAACPVPGAIANAVFDATGVRLRTLPFNPARVLAALA